MALTYHIDRKNKVVIAMASGVLTDEEVFGYQAEVWSREDVRGYDELIDMTNVDEIPIPTTDRLRGLAELSVTMDNHPATSKLAIVAKGDFDFGLGRMFQVYREMSPLSSKKVEVFRSLRDALDFLGIPDLDTGLKTI